MSTHTQQLLLILVLMFFACSDSLCLSRFLPFACSYPFATLNFGTGSLVASLCLQTRSTSLLSGAFKFLMGKTGKYLLCFHLVFALWSTQLCVYMQFVQERANFSHVDGKCTLKLTGWLSISHSLSLFLSLVRSYSLFAWIGSCVCHEFSANMYVYCIAVVWVDGDTNAPVFGS